MLAGCYVVIFMTENPFVFSIQSKLCVDYEINMELWYVTKPKLYPMQCS